MKTEKFTVTINELSFSETFSVLFNRKYSLLKVYKKYSIKPVADPGFPIGGH